MQINNEALAIIKEWSVKNKSHIIFTERGFRVQGVLERKGAYVKELNDLDYDLPIVNEAIVNYLTSEKHPVDTVNECTDFRKFQKIVRISGNYLYGVHNNERLTDRTFRVFASKNVNDGSIYKVKTEGGRLEKFGNTPEKCFIWNESVLNVEVPKELNRQWYIDLAIERIKSFGIEINELSLF